MSICIITYKRPEGLKRLLQGLNKLSFDKIEIPDLEIIVVDNDLGGVAKQICDEMRSQFRWIIKTDVEPQQGIAYARNKSVSLASKIANFIAIIDDDEIPEPSWLENLLWVQQEYNSDIVTGPTIPYFPDRNVPSWIVKGNFFAFPRYQTGEQRSVAFTNNVLVKAEIFRELNPVFNNRLALIGSSDSYLFLNLHKAGKKIVWADEAIVEDWVSPSRTNLKWILLRGYRTWSDYSSFEKKLYPSFRVLCIRIIKGFSLIILGFLRLFPSLIMGKIAVATSLLYIFRGLGTLGGLLEIHYQEYKQVASPKRRSPIS